MGISGLLKCEGSCDRSVIPEVLLGTFHPSKTATKQTPSFLQKLQNIKYSLRRGSKDIEKIPKHVPKEECIITKEFDSEGGGITTTPVMSCWRSLPRVPLLYPSQTVYVYYLPPTYLQ